MAGLQCYTHDAIKHKNHNHSITELSQEAEIWKMIDIKQPGQFKF